jgi:hypothetical protein
MVNFPKKNIKVINMTPKLATFKIEENKWKAFQDVADRKGSTASAMLKDFIDWVLEGNELPNNNNIDIDRLIDSKLAILRQEFLAEIAELRGELAA